MKRMPASETTMAIGRIVLLVKAYDEAITFYTDVLGMEVFVDVQVRRSRFVHLRFSSQPDVGVWLIRAEGPEQEARVGNQTGGQPLAVFYTQRLSDDLTRLRALGVRIVREEASDGEASYAHFLDVYGNELVLVELRQNGVKTASG
ncbi:VOC family protein [Variovorax sp. CY25R-8]|uniref:VOC family protein n=1 Tax=Variovorax sp. CY25R-8 TaxID=2855501 RepID=UPI0021BA6054|nr:VOC family protein [Variovorax sp. CY25R-8]